MLDVPGKGGNGSRPERWRHSGGGVKPYAGKDDEASFETDCRPALFFFLFSFFFTGATSVYFADLMFFL